MPYSFLKRDPSSVENGVACADRPSGSSSAHQVSDVAPPASLAALPKVARSSSSCAHQPPARTSLPYSLSAPGANLSDREQHLDMLNDLHRGWLDDEC